MGYFILALVCGFLASALAGYKSRNAYAWFAAGFFFPVIGLVILAFLPNASAQRAGVNTSLAVDVAGLDGVNRDGVKRLDVLRSCAIGQALRLVRDREQGMNPFAVEVRTAQGEQVGYVPSPQDRTVAQHLDAGMDASGVVTGIPGWESASPTACRIRVDLLDH